MRRNNRRSVLAAATGMLVLGLAAALPAAAHEDHPGAI